jgi:hypothetical protein
LLKAQVYDNFCSLENTAPAKEEQNNQTINNNQNLFMKNINIINYSTNLTFQKAAET